jgi:hypothetical protein
VNGDGPFDNPDTPRRQMGALTTQETETPQAVAAPCGTTAEERPLVAFGPVLPSIGSWEWVGADLAGELSGTYQTRTFGQQIPRADLFVVVKYDAARIIPQLPAQVPVIYCPVDCYGSSGEIDVHWALLRRCARIVIHAEPLRKYFQSYAPVEYLDHHIKFAAPLREDYQADGPILWVGMRSNLPPLAAWVNRHRLPGELVVLTNLEPGQEEAGPDAFGFAAQADVRIETWTAERQRQLTAAARVAIDVKGDDFRQRHKPPAKAIDFLASGLPLAMNAGSCSSRHLRKLGFELAVPQDQQRWLSRDYWEETRDFGARLRGELSREQIAGRLAGIIDDVLATGGER